MKCQELLKKISNKKFRHNKIRVMRLLIFHIIKS